MRARDVRGPELKRPFLATQKNKLSGKSGKLSSRFGKASGKTKTEKPTKIATKRSKSPPKEEQNIF